MLSLKNIDKAEAQKKQSQKIERELPYFVTIVSLLAASGFGPFTIFQKIKEMRLLPMMRIESIKILKRIELLGVDPLTAITETKEKQTSRLLGEFLSGYVSAIQSGGNVANYLKTKMKGAYDLLENKEKQSVEKLSGVIHGWLTMQIVILAVFILISAVGSNPLTGSGTQTNSDPPYVLLLVGPIISVFFLIIIKGMINSSIQEVETRKIIKFGIPSVLVASILILTKVFASLQIDAYILGGSLIVASIWPTLRFMKIYRLNIDAETSTPQILRDITEARKAGMGPEKCIIRACKRKDFKSFNSIANMVANKLEWGVVLNNIYEVLEKEIRNFQVLITFKILFEIISAGGGNVNSLDSLADASEKIHDIEKNKREMLKPYVIVGFMIITVTGFTTLLTLDSFANINEEKNLNKGTQPVEAKPSSFIGTVSIALVLQAWLSGLFIGKITKGAYSGGFMYSINLVIITMVCIGLIQLHLLNFNSLLKHS
ncbi:MAG: type II secretion system F family protein [Thaumarchaeota archaeon]|nr:type II secretion system F family protein [Nitrososphaerota archaeon]